MAPAATLVANEPAGGANSLSFGKTKDGKKLKIRSYPKFESLEEERLYRKQHLAAAFRVYVSTFPSHFSPFLPRPGPFADIEIDLRRSLDQRICG
jgi:hypothetical protein